MSPKVSTTLIEDQVSDIYIYIVISSKCQIGYII